MHAGPGERAYADALPGHPCKAPLRDTIQQAVAAEVEHSKEATLIPNNAQKPCQSHQAAGPPRIAPNVAADRCTSKPWVAGNVTLQHPPSCPEPEVQSPDAGTVFLGSVDNFVSGAHSFLMPEHLGSRGSPAQVGQGSQSMVTLFSTTVTHPGTGSDSYGDSGNVTGHGISGGSMGSQRRTSDKYKSVSLMDWTLNNMEQGRRSRGDSGAAVEALRAREQGARPGDHDPVALQPRPPSVPSHHALPRMPLRVSADGAAAAAAACISQLSPSLTRGAHRDLSSSFAQWAQGTANKACTRLSGSKSPAPDAAGPCGAGVGARRMKPRTPPLPPLPAGITGDSDGCAGADCLLSIEGAGGRGGDGRPPSSSVIPEGHVQGPMSAPLGATPTEGIQRSAAGSLELTCTSDPAGLHQALQLLQQSKPAATISAKFAAAGESVLAADPPTLSHGLSDDLSPRQTPSHGQACDGGSDDGGSGGLDSEDGDGDGGGVRNSHAQDGIAVNTVDFAAVTAALASSAVKWVGQDVGQDTCCTMRLHGAREGGATGDVGHTRVGANAGTKPGSADSMAHGRAASSPSNCGRPDHAQRQGPGCSAAAVMRPSREAAARPCPWAGFTSADSRPSTGSAVNSCNCEPGTGGGGRDTCSRRASGECSSPMHRSISDDGSGAISQDTGAGTATTAGPSGQSSHSQVAGTAASNLTAYARGRGMSGHSEHTSQSGSAHTPPFPASGYTGEGWGQGGVPAGCHIMCAITSLLDITSRVPSHHIMGLTTRFEPP